MDSEDRVVEMDGEKEGGFRWLGSNSNPTIYADGCGQLCV